jgi:hypothetical protein
MFGGASSGGLCGEVFEEGSWYGGEEIDIGRRVEALLQIGSDIL